MQSPRFSPGGPVVYAIDGEEDLEYYKALLATVGAHARHFTTPLEGLQAFLSTPPHLLIVDLDVAGSAGLAFLRLLRASPWHRTVPILACSSLRATPERQQAAFDAGADGYLEKPFVEEEFVEAMMALVEDSVLPQPPTAEPPQAGQPDLDTQPLPLPETEVREGAPQL